MKSKQLKKIFIFSIGLFAFGIVGYSLLTIWVKADFGEFTPDSSTTTTMYVLKRRILHFAKENNKLPNTIDELPEIEGFDNRDTDGWGWKIKMKIDGSEVSLISYGKDNLPGGGAANLDLIAIFEAKKKSGEWADENNEGHQTWEKLPKIRWDKSEFQ